MFSVAFTEASPQNSTAEANGNITVNKGDRIPGIARQTLKVRADCGLPKGWNVGATVIATSGQYAHGDENNQDANGMLAGYALVNLDTHYKMSANWEFFAKVTNLFDKDYHTFGILSQNMFTAQNEMAVVPAVPRGIWVGVTYRFGGRDHRSVDVD